MTRTDSGQWYFGQLSDLVNLILIAVVYEFLAIVFIYPNHLNVITAFYYHHEFLFLPTFFFFKFFSFEFTLLVSVGVRVWHIWISSVLLLN
jgi:hypothetical protein